jgi:hypothetical protein
MKKLSKRGETQTIHNGLFPAERGLFVLFGKFVLFGTYQVRLLRDDSSSFYCWIRLLFS